MCRRFLASLLLCVVLVTGCADPGSLVPPGWESLAPCAQRDLPAAGLDGSGEPGCDLEGSTLVFDDGTRGLIDEVGLPSRSASGAGPDREYQWVNWGVPGVGAAVIENRRLVRVWGSTPQAGELMMEQLRLSGVIS